MLSRLGWAFSNNDGKKGFFFHGVGEGLVRQLPNLSVSVIDLGSRMW